MGFEAGKKWSYAIRFQHQSRPGVYLLWWLLFWIGTLFFFLEPTAAESCTHNFLISSHPTTRLAVQEKVSGEELMKLINKVARWFKWFNGLLLLLLLPKRTWFECLLRKANNSKTFKKHVHDSWWIPTMVSSVKSREFLLTFCPGNFHPRGVGFSFLWIKLATYTEMTRWPSGRLHWKIVVFSEGNHSKNRSDMFEVWCHVHNAH